MARKPGSIAAAHWNLRWVAAALIILVGACTAILSLSDLGRPWAVTLQIVSVVAGAALGNVLHADFSKNVVRNQTRPAVRHLLDQATRLNRLVARLERRAVETKSHADLGVPLDEVRVADWFAQIGEDLRNEITSTATAIENWGDMAPDVSQEELTKYKGMERRLPAPDEKGEEQS